MMFMNNMENQSNSKDINIEEIIKPFKEKIRKLQDEISEKDSEIAQLKFKLMQYNNGNKVNNQFINNNMLQMNNKMNNNMVQMNNKMNNNMGQMNNNMGQMNNQMNYNMGQMNNNMGQMNNQMNPMNNNGNQMFMNMINNPFNMMNNQFNMNNMMNNFLMNNQMNQMNNMGNQIKEKLPRMGMGYQNQLIKNLSIKVRMEKGEVISVQCRSNDKMNNVIKIFCAKACINKEDYDFIFIKEDEVKSDSSIEQYGIKQKDYILAKKKLVNKKESQMDQSLNDKKEPYYIKKNPKILGKLIVLTFISGSGVKVEIDIGLDNTMKDAFILFCNKADINYSVIGKEIFFLFDAKSLNSEDKRTLGQIGFKNGCMITVIENNNVIGA